MSISFASPVWFALLALIVPLGFVMMRWCIAMARVRRWSAVGTRLVLIGLIAAMLAGASSVRETSKLAVVGVIDVSDSVRRYGWVGADEEGGRLDVIDAAERYFRRLDVGRGPDDLLGLVVFGGTSAAIATPTSASVDGRDFDLQFVEGTDIAGAVRLGSAIIPPDATGRMVLVSDGNETAGDVLAFANELASESTGVAIDVVPILYSIGDETIVESLIVPTRAAADSVVTVRVVISTIAGTSGTLNLFIEDQPVDINGGEPGQGRRLTLDAGRHAVLLDVPIGSGKIHRFRAVFEPDMSSSQGGRAYAGDTHLDNNQAEAFTISPGAGSILVVDGLGNGDPQGPGAILADRLTANGVDVRLVSTEGLPTDLLGYQPFDLVILQNIPADELSLNAQNLLASHVRDMGGGLIMVGGPASFGSGGWAGTPIEPILPVELDLKERLVERRTAIVLVLDASGSMGASVGGSFKTQQQIANSAAAIAARSLGENDLVGVIKFSNRATWVRQLGPNDDADATTSAIESISPGGGTNIPPALLLAREALLDTEAAVKHIIVLSDGQSQGADELPLIAAELALQGINVSTISVGDGADVETMFAMAEKGGGVHYPVTNPSVLPRIFVRAVRIVRDPLIKEGIFTPIVLPSGSPVLAGVGEFRPLGGLVLTRFRDDPQVTNVLATPEDEPILSYWNAGLGKVAAFTSDAHYWADPWLGWDGYDMLWSQLSRHIARSQSERGVELTTEIESGKLSIRMLSIDAAGNPVDGLVVPATVYGPGGERSDVTLEQTGPGQYGASSAAAASGNYITVIKPRQGMVALPPMLGGATQTNSAEYRILAANTGLLRQLADITGGRVLDINRPSAEELFSRDAIEPRLAESSLWRVLLMISIAVLLLDIATRRIAWDRFIAERSPKTATASVAPVAATLGQLKAVTEDQAEVQSTHLTDKDAAELAIGARRDRVESRKKSLSKPRGSGTPTRDDPGVMKEDNKNEESGLLAAKRRAQQRFDEE